MKPHLGNHEHGNFLNKIEVLFPKLLDLYIHPTEIVGFYVRKINKNKNPQEIPP